LVTYKAELINYYYSSLSLKFKDTFYKHKHIIIRADNMSVTKSDSTPFDFGIKVSYKIDLQNYFPFRPWVVTSQKFLTYQFSQRPNVNELDIICQLQMIIYKEWNILFP
jgi:hypothetical protein